MSPEDRGMMLQLFPKEDLTAIVLKMNLTPIRGHVLNLNPALKPMPTSGSSKMPSLSCRLRKTANDQP